MKATCARLAQLPLEVTSKASLTQLALHSHASSCFAAPCSSLYQPNDRSCDRSSLFLDGMEDCGLLAGDCVVICCCCPCLLPLQFVVFVVLRLPEAMARKMKKMVRRSALRLLPEALMAREMKKMVRRKPGRRRRQEKVVDEEEEEVALGAETVHVEGKMDACERGLGFQDDEVWEDLSSRGLFWFGSFWETHAQVDACEHIAST